jgi:hypothetical protein
MAVLGVQGALLEAAPLEKLADLPAGKRRRRKKTGEFDENLVVIISDLHTNPSGYQPARLERTIGDIVAMDPKPRNVIALGDLAYLKGKPEEYALLKEMIAPLEAAGICLTMAMGNHDRRKRFAEAFPERAAASLVEDRFVYVVETPRADFIVLDSLQEGPDATKWITPGALDDAQKAWLKERLSAYQDKPVFVMSHHPLGEIGIKPLLLDCPSCCGYIHGHNHIWNSGWVIRNHRDRDLLRTLCVPSTGHWGDIGYTLLELGETEAVARLQQYEFFFPKPLDEGEPKPAQWSMIEEEHHNALCRFAYR